MDLDIKVEFLENGTQMPDADSTKVSSTYKYLTKKCSTLIKTYIVSTQTLKLVIYRVWSKRMILHLMFERPCYSWLMIA